MTNMSFKTEMFQLSISNIKDGKGCLKLSMNKEFVMEVTANNFMEKIDELSNGLTVFSYNYYLRQMLRDVLKESEPKEVEESEGVQE